MSKSRKRKSSTPAPPPAQPVQDPLHQPIKPAAAQKSPFRARIDRVLPPFTAQRYIAIWFLSMIPLVGVLLILLRPWDARPSTSQATPTSTARSGLPTQTVAPSPTPRPVASPTSTGGARPPASDATLVEPDKYLVIETAKGRIVAKLHTTAGANVLRTVANFSERINSGALDGSTFFRVEDWLVQGGGDPDATSRLPAEYNKIPFTAGSVALAHGVDPAFNSDSQFLIAKTNAPQLDGQYTNLGQVIEGMDVVNKIVAGDEMTKVRVVGSLQ
ncbi:MAG TPA: peptidylprolyl isomerase [Chloroflexia bacterium]|nr:peptidylprolyl isomerase [Chloroflexia bacterium]